MKAGRKSKSWRGSCSHSDGKFQGSRSQGQAVKAMGSHESSGKSLRAGLNAKPKSKSGKMSARASGIYGES